MAYSSGKSAVVKLDASAGGSLTDYSAYCYNVSTSWPADLLETTTFGDASHEQIVGLVGGSFSVDFRADPAFVTVLAGLRGAAQTITFEIGPMGSTAGNTKITGECNMESMDISAAVDGLVEGSCSWQTSGTVTFTTY